METDPTEKLVLKIHADVETRPIEVNVQSAGVSEEEQVFFTEEDNETEEQSWERKRQSKAVLKVTETVIQIDAISENVVEEIANFTLKLRRTNQILLEQSKDPILFQLKAKIQNEEYSEENLQQDIRHRHYLNNLDRIVLKDEIVTRKYYDETGQIEYHQILIPKHLLKELLQAIHDTAHRHPGISKMLQEIRQKYFYPGIAKHVKKLVEGCETCARDKRVPNNTITPELLSLLEWDLGPEDAMQIDLLPNLPARGGYQTVMTAIDVFFKILICLPANRSNSHKCSQGNNRHHDETFIFTDNSHYGQKVRVYINHHSRNNSNFGHNTQRRHYKAPKNNWQAGKDARLTQVQLENGLRGISTTMAQILAIGCAIILL